MSRHVRFAASAAGGACGAILRRLLDAVLAGCLLVAGGLVVAAAMLRRRPRARFVSTYARNGERIAYRVLRLFPRGRALWALNYLLVLIPVIRGRISLTGSRLAWVARYAHEGARSAAAGSPAPCANRKAPQQDREASIVPPYAWTGERPGLLSPYVLQRRANLRSEGPDASDRHFRCGAPFKAHAALIARFMLSLALGAAPRRMPARVDLLGVEIANISMAATLERIAKMARGGTLRQVAFVNADCLNIGVRDPRYRDLLARLPLVLADGIGVRQALKWFAGAGLKENVNGTDLFPRLCKLAAERGLSLFLLGARPGVAEQAAQAAQRLAPGLKIAGTHHGYFSTEQTPSVIDAINASGADILLVAMGAPAQEFWIRTHAPSLRVSVAMGVGGLFDFYSGRIARAPLWMREIGLEWVYRLLQEPGRMWRRYLIGNPLFLWRAWRWSRGEGLAAAAREEAAPALVNAETSR